MSSTLQGTKERTVNKKETGPVFRELIVQQCMVREALWWRKCRVPRGDKGEVNQT